MDTHVTVKINFVKYWRMLILNYLLLLFIFYIFALSPPKNAIKLNYFKIRGNHTDYLILFSKLLVKRICLMLKVIKRYGLEL